MKKNYGWIWGVVLIVAGVIIGLNSLEVTNINIFFHGWWTLFIIVPSLVGLVKNDDKLSNMIGLLIGLSLLLIVQEIISFSVISKLLWPIILILIGIYVLYKNNKKIKVLKTIKTDEVPKKEYWATFGENNINFAGQELENLHLNSIFGSLTLDLTDAKIKEDFLIDATAIFGAINLIVPENVNVVVNSISIFGGTDQKAGNLESKKNKTVFVNTLCIFGGVDIK